MNSALVWLTSLISSLDFLASDGEIRTLYPVNSPSDGGVQVAMRVSDVLSVNGSVTLFGSTNLDKAKYNLQTEENCNMCKKKVGNSKLENGFVVYFLIYT